MAVDFIEADIDRPVIVGQLYNGADTPPFSAGEDCGINHPGVISGIHTQTNTHSLDGDGPDASSVSQFNQWAIDDASGQMRMRLLAGYTAAEIGLGHLIQQSASSAQRGAWRGSGFEATTQGWASVRAAKGLLISTTTRLGGSSSYGSAQSTQMDAQEALAQLRGATDLGQRLSEAATSATAQPLSAFEPNQSVAKLIDQIDPKKDAKHPGSVNGQEAKKAAPGSRTATDPVEAFTSPVIALDTPTTEPPRLPWRPIGLSKNIAVY